MNRIGFSVIWLACVGLWTWGIIYFFRSWSAILDLFEEVNAKVPYAMRYSLRSMNPLNPFRVWRKHREAYPQDTGVRHRVKCHCTISLALLVFSAGIILILIFVGR